MHDFLRVVECDGQRYLLHANFAVHICHNSIMPLISLRQAPFAAIACSG